MKKRVDFLSLFAWFVVLTALSACGLRYTPVDTPDTFKERRITAIKSYCETSFNKTGALYSPIQFGESKLIKPTDYKVLDSLYALKFNLEKQRKTDPKLEERINTERQRLLQSKASPIYLEEHLFSVKDKDSITFYFCTFQLTKQTEIEDVRIEQSIQLAARDEDRYYRFLDEDELYYSADLNEEQAFYAYFKKKADQLSGSKLDQFVDHVMRLMETIDFIQSTDPKTVVERMLLVAVHGRSYKQQTGKFEWKTPPPQSWKTMANNGFIVTYTTQPLPSSTEEIKTSVIEFTLDPYLMIDRKSINSAE